MQQLRHPVVAPTGMGKFYGRMPLLAGEAKDYALFFWTIPTAANITFLEDSPGHYN